MSEQKHNWVERREQVKAILTEASPTVWREVKDAIQDACKGYRDINNTREPYVRDPSPDGSRISVELPERLETPQGTITGITIVFNATRPAIEWVDDRGSHSLLISADENGAFVAEDDKRFSADQVSQRILEPSLYHNG